MESNRHPEALFPYFADTGNQPENYHDATCPCPRHCGNCLADLDVFRRPVRARYCGDHCKGQALRGRAFDRFMERQ